MDRDRIETFFREQLTAWPEVAERYKQTESQKAKYIREGQRKLYKVICNPLRSISVKANTAPTHPVSCPLCPENRPPEQQSIALSNGYTLLVNPYPIFNQHFTIAASEHLPQQIHSRFADFLALTKELDGYTVFYNGPDAGASIPQHNHFQAIPSEELPQHPAQEEKIIRHRSARLHLAHGIIPYFLITSTNIADAAAIFDELYDALDENERRMNNIIARYADGEWRTSIYIRQKHRPAIYYIDNSEKLTVSPAAAEMEGVVVTIDPANFERMNRKLWEDILREINITPERMERIAGTIKKSAKPYQVQIGILEALVIEFDLLTPYILNNKPIQGPQKVEYQEGIILFNGKRYTELLFSPCDKANARIRVSGVTIGKEFHWQQDRTQEFTGSWRILPAEGKLAGINIIDMEEYLKSVVSSEMSAHAPIELLKAHAMIARSWLLRMIEKGTVSHSSDESGLIWHEAEEHTLFDVCADDHCQRYQGITQITNPAAVQAVNETRGKVIAYNGEVIDARYSKCCGGITEEFSTAWGNINYPYLPAVRDTKANTRVRRDWIIKNADKWILESAPAWCNVTDANTIRMIMNDYDRETTDFYRWTVSYTTAELADIIRRKTGLDPGELLSIEPLERGPSGRIWKLRITGSLNTCIIGKELEIRRALSPTHLYSSAFIVDTRQDESGKPTEFIFHGAGWGHGVGLCQIGAANMAIHGYSCEQIISHYYKKTDIIQQYE